MCRDGGDHSGGTGDGGHVYAGSGVNTITFSGGLHYMQITDIRIRRILKEGKMKAVVSITFDNAFVVHDIKIIEGEKGLFIAMPSRKAADGEYRDIAHPINSETRDTVQTMVLQKYEELMEEVEEGIAAGAPVMEAAI